MMVRLRQPRNICPGLNTASWNSNKAQSIFLSL